MLSSSLSVARKLRLVFYTCGFALGAVSTWFYNLRYMAEHPGGFAVGTFLDEAFATNAAGSLSCDILVAAMVGMVWMLAEARRLRMRHAWIYLVVACGVAFAAALPLFLMLREFRLAEQEEP